MNMKKNCRKNIRILYRENNTNEIRNNLEKVL
ncbi:hypothetical protein J2Z72_000261 [Peptostreptococcus canis]|nr:hypothetical protein [Peptostreptococcus canis]